jgi:hypothetical protein
VPYCTTEVADSLVVHVTVAVVPDPLAATPVTTGAVVSTVAKDAGAAGGAGDVLVFEAASAEVTR